MKFTTAVVLFAGAVMAYTPCSGDLKTRCCKVDILGLGDLNCNDPTGATFNGYADFKADCRKQGEKRPRCCQVDVDGVDLLCKVPAQQ